MQKTDKKVENAFVKAREEALSKAQKLSFDREWMGEVNGIHFINDAKALDLDWTLESIKNTESPIIWLTGNWNQEVDYSWLKNQLNGQVEAVVAYGDFSKNHKYQMEATVPFYSEHETLAEAFNRVWAVANPKFTILFSPATEVEDEWSSWSERGLAFNDLVRNL